MSDMDDDLPVGRVLSRREAVRLLAVGGAAVLVGCDRTAASGATTSAAGTVASLPACVVKPELTVGPYFVDRQLDRSDIRVEPTTGKPVAGAPLALTFDVSQVTGGQCRPLAGAMIDVWHCDAAGRYSAVNDRMQGLDLSAERFLRGYQVTDAGGSARFTTVYPGWYRGRTVHVHFKIRTPASAALANDAARTYEFTSQLFFDEALSDRVFTRAPYAGRGRRDTRNADDGIFREAGDALLLAVAPDDAGYTARFAIGLDLSDAGTGRADRSGGGPGGAGGPAAQGGPPPRRPPADAGA